MDYWFNRESENDENDLEKVTEMEIYGKLAPSDSLVTPEEIEANAIDDEDVYRMREWCDENRL
ncbi:MAG: hypothetical protein RSA97_03995 [Oscillospiraceae bacterium]